MSYLQLKGLPEFKQAVISFWFRVPKASVDAAKAAADAAYQANSTPVFNGTVPLVVMGKPGKTADERQAELKYNVLVLNTHSTICLQGGVSTSPPNGCGDPYDVLIGNVTWHCCGTFVSSTHWFCDCFTYEDQTYTLGPDFGVPGTITTSITKAAQDSDPTFIGFDGSSLYINFESAKQPNVVGDMERTSITPGTETGFASQGCRNGDSGYSVPCGGCLCFGIITGTYTEWNNTEGMTDSYSFIPPTYNYTPVPGNPATCSISGQIVDCGNADEWHHVLISVDLRKISVTGVESGEDLIDSPTADRVSSSCKLWVAVDDKNYTQSDLPGVWVDGGGDNDVIPNDAWRTTRSSPQAMVQGDGTTVYGSMPIYDCDMSVPEGDVGLPATATYVKNLYKCEMAEFVMWTGVTLDTSVEANRRLFVQIDKKTGKLVPANSSPIFIPTSKMAVGDPANWDWSTGPTSPTFVPALSSLDPSAAGSWNKLLHTPDIDFTRCSFNWMMGRNLGKFKGKVTKTGKIKTYWPPDGSDPSVKPSTPSGGP